MSKVAVYSDSAEGGFKLANELEDSDIRSEVFTSEASILNNFSKSDIDIVLIDSSKVDVVERVSLEIRKKSDIPIMGVVSSSSEDDQIILLRIGCDDILNKPISNRILKERIRVLTKRNRKRIVRVEDDSSEKKRTVVDCGFLFMDEEKQVCKWDGENVDLTVSEFKILFSLSLRPGVIKERDDLIEATYDDEEDYESGGRLIDSHVKRIRRKFKDIGVDGGIIETKYGMGYKLNEDFIFGETKYNGKNGPSVVRG